MSRVARRVFGAPGDWLARRTSARQRRDIAAWLLIFYCATLPLRYVFKDRVWMVWLLSEIAIALTLATIVAAETPVEEED